MNYELQRSKRKTLAIQITKEATVLVKAPMRLSKRYIDTFVNEKKDWIEAHLTVMQSRCQEREHFAINNGTLIWYLGRQYPVKIGAGTSCFDGEAFCLVGEAQEDIRKSAVAVYCQLAMDYIQPLVNNYASQMDVQPTSVKISDARTRWGSCSGKNRINFTWRLILTSPACIEYVVVHELAHIKEHNHSKRFWNIVEGILPDWRDRRLQLREYADQIDRQNW